MSSCGLPKICGVYVKICHDLVAIIYRPETNLVYICIISSSNNIISSSREGSGSRKSSISCNNSSSYSNSSGNCSSSARIVMQSDRSLSFVSRPPTSHPLLRSPANPLPPTSHPIQRLMLTLLKHPSPATTVSCKPSPPTSHPLHRLLLNLSTH